LKYLKRYFIFLLLPGSLIILNIALLCSGGINCSGNSLRKRLSKPTANNGVNGCFKAFSRSAGCLIFTGSCRYTLSCG